jgi:hypothetical protein
MLNKNVFVQALAPRPVTPVAKPVISRTQNGMRAFSTTGTANVDLFGSIGSMRGKDVIPAFAQALAENKDTALRIAQWARDVRGGSGERKLYRDILLYLEKTDPQLLVQSKLLDNLPEIGRFDDLLIFTNPQVKFKAFGIIAKALDASNGLAAKWLPRKGPLAVELRETFGLSPRQYRKLLVGLTNVVESKMCAREFDSINFSHVPSVAMSRYMTAFHKRAPEAFAAYKAALKSETDPKVKANAGAVYPYQITKMLGGARDLSYGGFGYSRYSFGSSAYQDNEVATAMWKALPDYMNDKNVIAVCDNSGSMSTKVGGGTDTSCADVAASLAMYTASKTKGAFKNLSISFNDNAQFVQHDPNSLANSLQAVCSAAWGSTNLESVFNLILNHATKNRVPAEDMPKIVLIMSDMQFNPARGDLRAQDMIRRKYEDAGYETPVIVYWNLAAHDNKPVKFNENDVALVSGFSPAIMKSILAADLKRFSPESIMLQTVGSERYNW